MSTTIPETLAWTIDAARAAAAAAQRLLGNAERLTKSHAFTVDEAVTEVDRTVQRMLIERIAARFPDDGLIGEESDHGQGITNLPARSGDRAWVIDPLDGTNNFIAGLGCVAVCVGRMRNGHPELGVVHDLARNETWCGAVGHGAWLLRAEQAPRAIQVENRPLSASSLVMLTSNLLDAQGRLPAYVTRWLTTTPWKARMLGSAAIEAVTTADGTASAAFSPNAKLWDLAAAAAVVIAAGGVVRTPQGEAVFPCQTAAYRGSKTPFIVGGRLAVAELIADMRGA